MFERVRGHTFESSFLGPNPTIVDCGANKGNFSREMSERFGGKYLLVEANPVLFDALRTEGRFPLVHCALAAEDGSIAFNVANNDEGSSILTLPKESVIDCTLRQTVEVPAHRLERVLADAGITEIDLLKMDIEGAELQVFDALPEEMLRRIGQMTVEFHCDPLFGFGMAEHTARVIDRLRGLGFLCLDFSGRSRYDVLFINLQKHPIPWARRKKLELKYFMPAWLVGMGRIAPPGMRRFIRKCLGLNLS
jgi:FkbM family methyltransferase